MKQIVTEIIDFVKWIKSEWMTITAFLIFCLVLISLTARISSNNARINICKDTFVEGVVVNIDENGKMVKKCMSMQQYENLINLQNKHNNKVPTLPENWTPTTE